MEIVDEATWPSERLSVYISAERRALDRMAVRGGADDQPRWSVRRNGGERCVRPPESLELFVGVRGAPRISLALRTGYGGRVRGMRLARLRSVVVRGASAGVERRSGAWTTRHEGAGKCSMPYRKQVKYVSRLCP